MKILSLGAESFHAGGRTDMKLFAILPTRIKNRTINNVNKISVLKEDTKVAQTFLIKLNLHVMYSSF
jgi:hypothetical protein